MYEGGLPVSTGQVTDFTAAGEKKREREAEKWFEEGGILWPPPPPQAPR